MRGFEAGRPRLSSAPILDYLLSKSNKILLARRRQAQGQHRYPMSVSLFWLGTRQRNKDAHRRCNWTQCKLFFESPRIASALSMNMIFLLWPGSKKSSTFAPVRGQMCARLRLAATDLQSTQNPPSGWQRIASWRAEVAAISLQ